LHRKSGFKHFKICFRIQPWYRYIAVVLRGTPEDAAILLAELGGGELYKSNPV
jgi:hypothetical protein